MDGRCMKIIECLWAHHERQIIDLMRFLVFNRSGILFTVWSKSLLHYACIIFINVSKWCVRGCEYVIRSNTSNTLSRSDLGEMLLETPFDATYFGALAVICLGVFGEERSKKDAHCECRPNEPNIHLFLVNSINLLFCYRCYMPWYYIIIYFVNEHDTFCCFFSKSCMRCWVPSLRVIFSLLHFTPFRILCVFFPLYVFLL